MVRGCEVLYIYNENLQMWVLKNMIPGYQHIPMTVLSLTPQHYVSF